MGCDFYDKKIKKTLQKSNFYCILYNVVTLIVMM